MKNMKTSPLSLLAVFALILSASTLPLAAVELQLGVTTGASGGTGIQYTDLEGSTGAFTQVGSLNTMEITSAPQSTDELGNPVMRLVLTPTGLAQIIALQEEAFKSVPPGIIMVIVEGQQVGLLDFGPGNESGAVTSRAKPVGIVLTISEQTKPFVSKIVASIGQP